MPVEIKVFVAQFIVIYLLGFQQQNVTGKHYFMAFITSLILGVSSWFLTSVISVANLDAIGSLVWWSFILSGPIAIVMAMRTHSRIVKAMYSMRKGNG